MLFRVFHDEVRLSLQRVPLRLTIAQLQARPVPQPQRVSPRFKPAAAERAAGRGQPGRRQEAGRAAEAARARAVRGP